MKKDFRQLLFASFVSQAGSHFLTLSLAIFVLLTTKLPTKSAFVFILSFLPSILVSAKIGTWIDKKISRSLMCWNEIISILATMLVGVCVAFKLPLGFLCLTLGLRSILLFVNKSATIKWLKIITPVELQIQRIKIYYLSFFLSTTLSGLMASIILNKISIESIVKIDIVSYLISIIFLMRLKSITLENKEKVTTKISYSLMQTLTSIFSTPNIRISFLFVCFSQTLFQGAYSTLVTYLPIIHFNLGVKGAGLFQLAASFGIILGFIINWIWPNSLKEKSDLLPNKTFLISIFASGSLLLSVFTSVPILSLVAFTFLNFLYEYIWLHHSAEFFRVSPKNNAASYQFALSSCAAFLMSICIFMFSCLIQNFGLMIATIVSIVFYSIIMLLMLLSSINASLEINTQEVKYE